MSLDDVKQLLEQNVAIANEMKATHAEALKRAEKYEAKAVAEAKAAMDVEAFQAELDKKQEQIDNLELAVKRDKLIDNAMDQGVPNSEKKHFDAVFGANGYMRTGDAEALKTELKAMHSLSNSNGGYLIPASVSSKILTIVNEMSPVRQYASIENITSDRLILPIDEALPSVTWGSSVAAVSETTTPTVGEQEIPVRDMNAEPRASQNFLEDAGTDVAAWLIRKVTEAMAIDEGRCFVSGNGVNEPRGFLTYPAGSARPNIEQVVSGDANAITGDLFIKLEGALKKAYRQGAIYALNRSSESKARLLKDGQNNYLWQPSYQAGAPRTINGYAYDLFDDMPDVTAGALAVAFGNFARGYQIVDRAGIRVIRDELTAKPWVKFYTTKRVGGDVITFEAIKIGKVANS